MLHRIIVRLGIHREIETVVGIGPTMLLGMGLVALSMVVMLRVTAEADPLAREDLAFALSVVHQLADEAVRIVDLLTSPLRQAPQPSMPLPPDLFGFRGAHNSRGLDLSVPEMRVPLAGGPAAAVQVPRWCQSLMPNWPPDQLK